MTKKTPEEIAALKAKYAAENATKSEKRADKKVKYFKEPEAYQLPEFLQTIPDLKTYSAVRSPDGWFIRKSSKDKKTQISVYTDEWRYEPERERELPRKSAAPLTPFVRRTRKQVDDSINFSWIENEARVAALPDHGPKGEHMLAVRGTPFPKQETCYMKVLDEYETSELIHDADIGMVEVAYARYDSQTNTVQCTFKIKEGQLPPYLTQRPHKPIEPKDIQSERD